MVILIRKKVYRVTEITVVGQKQYCRFVNLWAKISTIYSGGDISTDLNDQKSELYDCMDMTKNNGVTLHIIQIVV